jgi:hypothetical protein
MTNPSPYHVEHTGEEIDALIQRHRGRRRSFAQYDGGLDAFLGFVKRELKARPPWQNRVHPERSQHAIVESFFAHHLTAVSTANGVGKDYAMGLLALWWIHAHRGRVILISAGEDQAVQVSMAQVAQLWRPNLGSDLYRTSIRTDSEAVGLQVRAASTVHRLTGFHNRVLGIISEVQGCPDAVLEAAMSWHPDKLLVLGNPVAAVGRFFRITRPGSGWHVIEISALDHPNLNPASGERPIAGGPTERGLKDMARLAGGETTSYYIARALGRFPDSAEHCPIPRSWVDRAHQLLAGEAPISRTTDAPPVCGVDLGTTGDRSVIQPVVERPTQGPRRSLILARPAIVLPRDPDTMATRDRVSDEVQREGVRPNERRINPAYLTQSGRPRAEPERDGFGFPLLGQGAFDAWGLPSEYIWTGQQGELVVDAVGLGKGAADSLKADLHYKVTLFNGGRKAVYSRLYADVRTEIFVVGLVKPLEHNRLGLPDDEELTEELVTIKLLQTPDGRVRLESKDDLKPRLGRSPDKLDALMMAMWGIVRPGHAPRNQVPVHW